MGMSPTTPAFGLSRSAAAINEEIRALMAGGLRVEDRARYAELREEWVAAVAAEMATAA